MTEFEKVLEGLGIARENVGFSTKWGAQERDREEIDSAITLLRAQAATIAERDAEIERLSNENRRFREWYRQIYLEVTRYADDPCLTPTPPPPEKG